MRKRLMAAHGLKVYSVAARLNLWPDPAAEIRCQWKERPGGDLNPRTATGP